MSDVEFRVIGPFRVSVDGRELTDRELGSRKARLLLQQLAVDPGRLVSTDRLVDVLWPSGAPEHPADSVATLVSRLRRVLGPGVLRGGRGAYALEAASVRVDLLAAEALAAEARSQLPDAPALAAAASRRALDLLADGDVLPNEPDAEWAEPTRHGVRRLLRQVRLDAADAALRTGDPAAALPLAQAAVAADSTDELACRVLMRAYQSAGEPAEALAAYEALRNRLAAELGTDPAPETRQLHLAVLQERQPPPPEPARRARTTAGGLVGRAAEVAALTRGWTDAAGGQSGLLLVCGEAGIGKTMLAEQLATVAEATGGEVLRARCHETERSLFLQPIVEALTDCVVRLPPATLRELVGDRAAALAALLPDVAAVLGRASLEGVSVEAQRLRTYDAVATFLRQLAARRPVLVLIDDLHHAGLAVLELLHFLHRRTAGSRLLVLATVRTEEGGQVLTGLADVADRLDVGPLSPEAVAQLTDAAGQSEHLEAILSRTRGHTLYVVETLRGLRAGDADANRTLAEVVLARVARAGEEAERVLRAAAVVGASFEPAVVARLLGLPDGEGVRRCEDLLRARLVVVAGRSYEFAHDLVREVLYETTPMPTRVAYHEAAADLLADRPEAMAAHAAAIEDWARAARAWLRAAEAAGRRFAVADAKTLLDCAIEAAERTEDNETLGRAYLARGRVHETLARYDLAIEDTERAVTAASVSTDSRLWMRALRALGGDSATAVGHSAGTCLARLRQGLTLADSLGDRGMQADFLARMAVLMANQLQFSDSIRHAARAVDVARVAGDTRALVKALDGAKTSWAYLGESEQLLPVLAELEPLLRRTGDLWRLQWTVFESAFPLVGAAQWPAAEARIEAALALNRRSGYVAYERWLTAHLGWLARLQGCYDAALQIGRSALDPGPDSEHPWFRITAAAMLATTLLEMGETEEARAVLAALPAARIDGPTEAYQLRYHAAVAQATGSAESLVRADTLLHAIDAPPGGAWMLGTDAYLAVARAWLSVGRADRAMAAVEPLLRAAERLQWLPAVAEGMLVVGMCKSAVGEEPAARAAYERAHAVASTSGMTGVQRAASERLADWTGGPG